MTELYTEHLYLDSGIQHQRVFQMKGRDLRPEYLELRRVHSESEDRDYLLGKVSVLDVPFNDADAVADRVDVWVCSCPDFHFNQSDGVETGDRNPSDCGHCKHIRKEVKHIEAQADDKQTEL